MFPRGGTCTSVSNPQGFHTWTCPDTGDKIQNGINLSAITFNGAFYACGDTIVLQAGAKYANVYFDGTQNYVRGFRFFSGCGPILRPRIVSSQLAAIPHNLKQLWPTANPAQKAAYISQMAILEAQPANLYPRFGDQQTMFFQAGAGGYYFGGIAFASPLGMTVLNAQYDVIGTTTDCSHGSCPVGSFASDIELDRCFAGTQEEYTYGAMEDWLNPAMNNWADVNTFETFFRAVARAVRAEGDRWYIHDSVLVSTGFDPDPTLDPTFNCSSGTNANPPVLTCTGIAATLGLGPGGFCFAVLRGATGGWAGPGRLNGPRLLGFVDADHVSVFDGWHQTNPDSTSWGAFSGSVNGKSSNALGNNVHITVDSEGGGWNLTMVNNWAADSGGAANLFFGGGNVMVNNTATITSGSCPNPQTSNNTCTINASNVNNMKLGDWVWFSTGNGQPAGGNLLNLTITGGVPTFNFTALPPGVVVGQAWNVTGCSTNSINTDHGGGPVYVVASISGNSFTTQPTVLTDGVYNNGGMKAVSRSPCCPASELFNNACALGTERVGIVTGLSGTNITVSGANAGLICVDPGTSFDIGGGVRWDGRNSRYHKIVGNAMHRTNQSSAKAYCEAKQFQQCLYAGNTHNDTPYNTVFIETHPQGQAPWVNDTLANISWNVFGSSAGGGSQYGFDMVSQDPESSNMPGFGPRFRHNISVDMPFVTGFSTNQIFGPCSGSFNCHYDHNSVMAGDGMSSPPYEGYFGSDICNSSTIPFLGTYFQAVSQSMSFNIMGYGNGAFTGAHGFCDKIPDPYTWNVFLNDQNQSPDSWIAPQNNQFVGMPGTKASLGFVGTCTADTYWQCELANSSAYKATMPDGSDPGADALAVQDIVNMWSESSGIRIFDPQQADFVNNPAAFNLGTSTAAITFGSVSPSTCTIQLFTNLARSVAAADTSSAVSCIRSGSFANGNLVTFVGGTASPLTTKTTYSYQIIDGSRTMVGTFTTH